MPEAQLRTGQRYRGDYWDRFLGADIGLIDPDIDAIIGHEEERQARKLIMIPSESMAPKAVRQALGSVFNNVYAEGYPPLRMTRDDEQTLLDIPHQLAYYRRYADRRFYKGVEYVHFVETLAQRRAADCLANERVPSSEIYVNVQPLSGAAANLAVYDTLLDLGDTVMGMDLYQGGHLTHGSAFNFSGKRYRVASYGVSKSTGRLDYDEIRDLARLHRPKMIIAGFTSYTWAPDWEAFAAIAREVGARLLADISHPAGMVIAGAFPSPVGVADVITFTTHKTLCGPRGAVIVTTDEELARRIDLAVFPGEQGGPHPQKFAAMAVAFKIAQTDAFRRLQWRIKENAAALAEGLTKRGLRLAYGGTDTHFCMLDLNGVAPSGGRTRGSAGGHGGPPLHNGHSRQPLRGEPAVRILDLAGIVANKNTIPGDQMTSLAMGIRLGTPWLTQRGYGPAEVDQVAGLIHKVVTHIQPFSYDGLSGELPRGKIELDVLEEVKQEVAGLAARGAAETADRGTGYPHYYSLASINQAAEADISRPDASPNPAPNAVLAAELAAARERAALQESTLHVFDFSEHGLLLISGERAEPGLNQIVTCDVAALRPWECAFGFILDPDGRLVDDVCIMRLSSSTDGGTPGVRGPAGKYTRFVESCDGFVVRTHPANRARVAAWLRALSDGYTVFDRKDLLAKIEGPLVVEDLTEGGEEGRRAALMLHGPSAKAILSMLRDRPAVMAFTRGDEHAELVLPAAQMGAIWDLLVEAGATPAGPEALSTLRAEWGLPCHSRGGGYGPELGRLAPLGVPACGEALDPREGVAAPELYARCSPARFELRKPYFVGHRSLDPIREDPHLPQFAWSEPEATPLRRTPLYEWHRAHTNRIIPFAGWEMPVWYTGVLDEHNAVRRAAGLFDVAHMGVFEISGPHAAEFLDLVCTNYVRWYAPGESFYSYLLDPDGRVIDDLLVYRRAHDRFLLVVNAVNAEKDWAWLNAANGGDVLIDRDRPATRVLRPASLRDLKDPSAGPDRRVDLALQGPASLRILQSLTDDSRLAGALARVRRTGLMECQLKGIDLVIARTGYTGEDVGYEIFVHPDQAVALWEMLFESGRPLGLQAAGLAARDSTRTEAGLPLYGHELAGPFDISPAGAGFAGYVKLHKPYFIGRAAYLEREKTPLRATPQAGTPSGAKRGEAQAGPSGATAIARFRMNARGVRMPKTGDPVVNRKGQAVGWVTSAAVDVDGIILGLAYLESRHAQLGDEIGVFSLPAKALFEKANKAELVPGDRVHLPDAATIIRRFPGPPERAHWLGGDAVPVQSGSGLSGE